MADEADFRRKTATITRMLNLQGSIGMFGHVSVRVPGAHLHARHATVLGIAGHEVVPVFLHGAFLRGGVPTWNNPRLVMTEEQAADLSHALGEVAVQMRGHGSVAVGESAEAAFFAATFLEENACKQLEAEIVGGAVPLSPEEALDCANGFVSGRATSRVLRLWVPAFAGTTLSEFSRAAAPASAAASPAAA